MTKVTRMLAGGGLAAVLGAILFGFVGAFGAHQAAAETPPNPPARFAGSVLVDGVAPPPGTVISAKIGSASCGVTSTFNVGAESRYVLEVPALDPGATPNCGAPDAIVTFFIGDKLAKETGVWANYQLNILNLTYTTPATPTSTASASPTGSATGSPTGGTATGTPRAPSTGSGEATSDDNSLWLWVAAAGIALAFSAGGVAVSRRSR